MTFKKRDIHPNDSGTDREREREGEREMRACCACECVCTCVKEICISRHGPKCAPRVCSSVRALVFTDTRAHKFALYFCSGIDFGEQLRSIMQRGLDVLT